MASNQATSSRGSAISPVNVDVEPDSVSNAIQVLDNTTRQIRAVERRLNQQRVDAAILLVELATLHDPGTREEFAVVAQTSGTLVEELNKCKMAYDQYTRKLLPSFPDQNPEACVKENSAKEPGSPQAAASTTVNTKEPKHFQILESQERMEKDSIKGETNEHHAENYLTNHFKLTDNKESGHSSVSVLQNNDDGPQEVESEGTDGRHEGESVGTDGPQEGESEETKLLMMINEHSTVP